MICCSFLSNVDLQKTKTKSSGLPDGNVIFFVATKKTKQKKTSRCAGHVVLEVFWWQGPTEEICASQHFPRYPRGLLGPLWFWFMLPQGVFLSFAVKDHDLEGPHPGPDSLFVPHLKGYEIWQRSCPPQGARPFLLWYNYGDTMVLKLCPHNYTVWRDATRRFCFWFSTKTKEQHINNLRGRVTPPPLHRQRI